jgi:hypothetical protein
MEKTEGQVGHHRAIGGWGDGASQLPRAFISVGAMAGQ